MLQRIRSNLQGIVARVIIGLITIPFVLWGVDAFFLDSGSADVAKVNGDAISELELNQQVYRQRQQMLARMGEDIDASQIDEAMLRGPVLEQLIQKRLLESAAQSRGLRVSGAMVDAIILQQSDFQVDGVFSPQRFEMLVRGSGMTPLQYKEAMKKQILVNQLLSGFAATEFVTRSDMELAARISEQQRDIEYVLMTVEQALEKVAIEQQEVRSYFDAHPEEFVTPETVAVAYIQLQVEDFYPDIDDSEIRTVYEQTIANMETVPRRRASHILIELGEDKTDETVREQLQSMAARLAEGESFAELALEYSDDIGSREQGGDLGYSDGSAFPEAFESALAQLQVGEVSAPVKTDAGWHLIKLVDIEEADVPDFESMREDILAQLQMEKAEPLYAIKLEELKDISFNAPDLRSVAEQLDLDLQLSASFGREGAPSGLFADKRLIAEAFTGAVLEQGANSEVIELSPSSAVVLRLSERTPSEPIPFAQVERDLTERLHAEKATAYMLQRAEDILEALRGGQVLADLAAAEGLDYRHSEAVTRNAIADVPQDIAVMAFQLSPPAQQEPSYTSRALDDGNVVVVGVTRVEPGSLAQLDADSQKRMKRLLSRYRAERIIEGYRADLQQAADIEML